MNYLHACFTGIVAAMVFVGLLVTVGSVAAFAFYAAFSAFLLYNFNRSRS